MNTIKLTDNQLEYLRDFVRGEEVAADAECDECGEITSIKMLKKCIVYTTLKALGDASGCKAMISDFIKCNCCEKCENLFDDCSCKDEDAHRSD